MVVYKTHLTVYCAFRKLQGKFNEQRKLAEDAQKKYKEGIEHYTLLVSTGKFAFAVVRVKKWSPPL